MYDNCGKDGQHHWVKYDRILVWWRGGAHFFFFFFLEWSGKSWWVIIAVKKENEEAGKYFQKSLAVCFKHTNCFLLTQHTQHLLWTFLQYTAPFEDFLAMLFTWLSYAHSTFFLDFQHLFWTFLQCYSRDCPNFKNPNF